MQRVAFVSAPCAVRQNQRLGRDGDQSDLTPTLQQLLFHLLVFCYKNIPSYKNHWINPYFAPFISVKKKLQLAVSLNHPVQCTLYNVYTMYSYCVHRYVLH